MEDETEEDEIGRAFAGLTEEMYAAAAVRMNDRQLHCSLRDARKKLAHHGRRSFMGREAKKEIEAAAAEMDRRCIE